MIGLRPNPADPPRSPAVRELERGLFLASEDSRFITGTTQVIDGGLSVQ